MKKYFFITLIFLNSSIYCMQFAAFLYKPADTKTTTTPTATPTSSPFQLSTLKKITQDKKKP